MPTQTNAGVLVVLKLGNDLVKALQDGWRAEPLMMTEILQRLTAATCIESKFSEHGRRLGMFDDPFGNTGVKVAVHRQINKRDRWEGVPFILPGNAVNRNCTHVFVSFFRSILNGHPADTLGPQNEAMLSTTTGKGGSFQFVRISGASGCNESNAATDCGKYWLQGSVVGYVSYYLALTIGSQYSTHCDRSRPTLPRV